MLIQFEMLTASFRILHVIIVRWVLAVLYVRNVRRGEAAGPFMIPTPHSDIRTGSLNSELLSLLGLLIIHSNPDFIKLSSV